jgi:hypothetical protein
MYVVKFSNILLKDFFFWWKYVCKPMRCCQLFLRILAIFCYGEIFEAATFFLVPPSLTLGLLFLESLSFSKVGFI